MKLSDKVLVFLLQGIDYSTPDWIESGLQSDFAGLRIGFDTFSEPDWGLDCNPFLPGVELFFQSALPTPNLDDFDPKILKI